MFNELQTIAVFDNIFQKQNPQQTVGTVVSNNLVIALIFSPDVKSI